MEIKVDWDLTDDDKTFTPDEVGVPVVVEVPDEIEEEDITEWLSDKYGWCLFGWKEI